MLLFIVRKKKEKEKGDDENKEGKKNCNLFFAQKPFERRLTHFYMEFFSTSKLIKRIKINSQTEKK